MSDGPIDRWTDKATFRVSCTRLKLKRPSALHLQLLQKCSPAFSHHVKVFLLEEILTKSRPTLDQMDLLGSTKICLPFQTSPISFFYFSFHSRARDSFCDCISLVNPAICHSVSLSLRQIQTSTHFF